MAETPKQFRVRAVAGARTRACLDSSTDSTGARFAASERSHNGRYSVVDFNGDLYIQRPGHGHDQAPDSDG